MKAVVVDLNGSIVARAATVVDRWTTSDGGVEQDIDQIWDAACQALRKAAAEVDAQSIQAIGISSQGGAMQLLDEHSKPIGRVISWLDQRGKPFDEQIENEWGEAYLIDHTGSNLSTTSLGQIMRLWHQSPVTMQNAREIGYVGDLIVARLCGRRTHDATSLSLAMLYNPRLGKADPDLLRRLKINDKQLPELLSASEPAGGLQAEAAAATGLPEGIPVSTAIHDQYAAALGAGVVVAGDVMVGTGTAWVLLAIVDRLAPPVASRSFVCSHPVEGLFGQLFAMGGVGEIIASALEVTGKSGCSGAALDELIASVPPGAEGLHFRPSSPASAIRESLSAIASHPPGHVLRAVIEGLSCELARHLSRFTSAGLPLNRLVVSGPASSGCAVPQILANIVNRPVTCLRESAVSAMGAATLARALVGPQENLLRPELSRKLVVDENPTNPPATGAFAAAQGSPAAAGSISDLARRLACDDCKIMPDADVEAYQSQFQKYLASFNN